MDYQTALTEFSGLLQVGAGALENIVSQQDPELQAYISELSEIATRLREIGDGIAEIVARTKA